MKSFMLYTEGQRRKKKENHKDHILYQLKCKSGMETKGQENKTKFLCLQITPVTLITLIFSDLNSIFLALQIQIKLTAIISIGERREEKCSI